MKYESVADFIKKHLRYKQHWNKKYIGIKDAVWQTLEEDTYLGDCEYAKGSQFKVLKTQNFGFVVFGPNTVTPDGAIPAKRIHKW